MFEDMKFKYLKETHNNQRPSAFAGGRFFVCESIEIIIDHMKRMR
jgi:hypothetical protein